MGGRRSRRAPRPQRASERGRSDAQASRGPAERGASVHWNRKLTRAGTRRGRHELVSSRCDRYRGPSVDDARIRAGKSGESHVGGRQAPPGAQESRARGDAFAAPTDVRPGCRNDPERDSSALAPSLFDGNDRLGPSRKHRSGHDADRLRFREGTRRGSPAVTRPSARAATWEWRHRRGAPRIRPSRRCQRGPVRVGRSSLARTRPPASATGISSVAPATAAEAMISSAFSTEITPAF